MEFSSTWGAAALSSGQIAAAGLDVYAQEPHIPNALAQLPNAVLFPHIGSSTIETRRAMGQLVVDNLGAFFADEDLLTPILSTVLLLPFH